MLDNLRSEEFQLRYHIINRDYWSLFKFAKGLAEKPIVKEVCILERIKSRMDRVRSEMRKLREGKFEEIKRVEFLEKDELQDFSDFILETFEKIKEYYDNMEFAQGFYVNLPSSISEIVLVADREGRILYANRAIERTGYTLNEVIGESIDRFVKREEVSYKVDPTGRFSLEVKRRVSPP